MRVVNTRAAPLSKLLLVAPAIERTIPPATVELSILAVVSAGVLINIDPQVFHHGYLHCFHRRVLFDLHLNSHRERERARGREHFMPFGPAILRSRANFHGDEIDAPERVSIRSASSCAARSFDRDLTPWELHHKVAFWVRRSGTGRQCKGQDRYMRRTGCLKKRPLLCRVCCCDT